MYKSIIPDAVTLWHMTRLTGPRDDWRSVRISHHEGGHTLPAVPGDGRGQEKEVPGLGHKQEVG